MSASPSFFECFKSYRAFNRLPEAFRQVVFYSEGKTYWPFLRPLIDGLLRKTELSLTYISSETDDPGLTCHPERVRGLVIGKGLFRSFLFANMNAKTLLMTLPELDVYHVKRSVVAPVYYIYLMHGVDSLHAGLPERSFDHYDALFCVGKHQVEEARQREKLAQLPAKRLAETGYPYLDDLIAEAQNVSAPYAGDRAIRVVIAPTWSREGTGILENFGKALVQTLLDAGIEVTVRPHSQTWRFHPQCLEALRAAFSEHPHFTLETTTTDKRSLMNADVLIGDWGSAPLEFAFGRLRPVLFFDTPMRVMNPNYRELGIEPFEVRIRGKLGEVLRPDEIEKAPEAIRRLTENLPERIALLESLRNDSFFQIGRSVDTSIDELLAILNEQTRRENKTGE